MWAFGLLGRELGSEVYAWFIFCPFLQTSSHWLRNEASGPGFKGMMEDCKRATGAAVRLGSPERGRWMSLWPFQRCENQLPCLQKIREAVFFFNLCNSPSILSGHSFSCQERLARFGPASTLAAPQPWYVLDISGWASAGRRRQAACYVRLLLCTAEARDSQFNKTNHPWR